MTFEEADNRLVAGWHVELPEADVLASAQRKRYLRLERVRFFAAAEHGGLRIKAISQKVLTDF